MKWAKGADVRVRYQGKIWDAQVEDHVPPPNDFGYVKAKYKLYLPEYMGGRGIVIVVEQDQVMPSRDLSERVFEPGDRFMYNGRSGVIVGPAQPVWNGREMAAPKNAYEVAFDDVIPDPNSLSPRERARTQNLAAGLMEQDLRLDELPEVVGQPPLSEMSAQASFQPGDVVSYDQGKHTGIIVRMNGDEVSLRGSSGAAVRNISEIELDITQTLALRERENRDQTIADMERGLGGPEL
jgi:hypothetical protein